MSDAPVPPQAGSATASALVLTFNRLPFLKVAVASALAQDHPALEVLVLDNGSTDGTAQWLAGIDDPRLRVLRMPSNRLPTKVRNLGLQHATGDWVGFLDDDDVWAPDKVSAMIEEAQRQQRAWVYCGCVYIDEHNRLIGGRPPRPVEEAVAGLPVSYTIPGGLSGLMWRRVDVPIALEESMSYCNDWDVALNLLRHGLPAMVDRPLIAYRQHAGAWSSSVADQVGEFGQIAARHADLRGDQPVHVWMHHRYVGGQALRAGARLAAARHYVAAIRNGDIWAVPRLLMTALPRAWHGWLRLHVLSDRRWLSAARAWLETAFRR